MRYLVLLLCVFALLAIWSAPVEANGRTVAIATFPSCQRNFVAIADPCQRNFVAIERRIDFVPIFSVATAVATTEFVEVDNFASFGRKKVVIKGPRTVIRGGRTVIIR